jgi:hypothetical protein
MNTTHLPLRTRFRLVAQNAAMAVAAGSAAALSFVYVSDELSQTDVLAASVIAVAAGAVPVVLTKVNAARERFVFSGAVAGFVLAGVFGYHMADNALKAQDATAAIEAADDDGTLAAQKACKKALRSGVPCHVALK